MVLLVIAADEGSKPFKVSAADCIAGARGLTNCGNVRARWAEKNPGSVLAERGDFMSDSALVSCEASRGGAAPQRAPR